MAADLQLAIDGEGESLKANVIWLPKDDELLERIVCRGPGNMVDQQRRKSYWDFLSDKGGVEQIERYTDIEKDHIRDLRSLMFAMDYRFGKTWNFEEQIWEEIKR